MKRAKLIGTMAILVGAAVAGSALVWCSPAGRSWLRSAILARAQSPAAWLRWAVREAVEHGDERAIEAAILHPSAMVNEQLYRALDRIEKESWARLVSAVMPVSEPPVQMLQAQLLVESGFPPNLWALAGMLEADAPEVVQVAIQLWSEILVVYPEWLARERVRTDLEFHYELERIARDAGGQVAGLCVEILEAMDGSAGGQDE